jgi:hypothetical protein
MLYTDSLGQAYLCYDEYAKEMAKNGKEPVNFFKFLIGKR